MNQDHITRVAAENTARKEALRFTVNLLASLAGHVRTTAPGAAVLQQLIAAAHTWRGEVLASISPSTVGPEAARIGNEALRAVIDEFDVALQRALKN